MSTQSDLAIHPPLFIPSYDRNGVSNDRDWPAATIPLSARSLYLPSFYLSLSLSLSRMSTSSTGKTVNYNQQEAATTTCEREIFRSTDRGWRDARERTEDTGKGRKGKREKRERENGAEQNRTERNEAEQGSAAQRAPPRAKSDELCAAPLVGACVCPCIHPCTPGGGDRRVLISPPPPFPSRRSLAPARRAPAVCAPVAAPATFPRRHTHTHTRIVVGEHSHH